VLCHRYVLEFKAEHVFDNPVQILGCREDCDGVRHTEKCSRTGFGNRRHSFAEFQRRQPA
jgi:hypothetical protein